MKPVAEFTPSDLTQAGKEALQIISRNPPRRVLGGWLTTGRKISLKLADKLIARGFARVEFVNGRQQLTATGSGRAVLHVLKERRRA